LDYIYYPSNDWFSYLKIKIMKIFNNIFLRKKILIYGLGKSGISSYKFLKNKSDVYLFDDNQKIKLKLKKKIIKLRANSKNKF